LDMPFRFIDGLRRSPFQAAIIAIALLPAFLALNKAEADTTEHVTAKLIADVTAVTPGKPFKLGVELLMQPGWHTYYKESGDAGMPTKIEWHLPKDFTQGSLYWVKPQRFNDAGIVTFGYQGKTIIAQTISPPSKIASQKLNFSADV